VYSRYSVPPLSCTTYCRRRRRRRRRHHHTNRHPVVRSTPLLSPLTRLMCVCVCAYLSVYIIYIYIYTTRTYTLIYIYIYIHIVCRHPRCRRPCNVPLALVYTSIRCKADSVDNRPISSSRRVTILYDIILYIMYVVCNARSKASSIWIIIIIIIIIIMGVWATAAEANSAARRRDVRRCRPPRRPRVTAATPL